MTPDAFKEIVLLLGFAILIILISQRLKLPSVIGFLITGVVIGSSGLRLIKDLEQIHVMAEIGAVMLLFTIGLEFSPERLKTLRRYFWVGGSWQITLTVAIHAVALAILGASFQESIFNGFLLCLSSTALVLKIYEEKKELQTPHGNISLGIMLFQDFVVVPMIILVPILGGRQDQRFLSLIGDFALKVLLMAGIYMLSRYLIPVLLKWIVRTRIRELFVITSLFLCLGMSWLTSALGFSMALGAFMAGIILSESSYCHQVVSDIMPFRDLFNSIFFISIGMLLNLEVARFFLSSVLILAFWAMALKIVVVYVVVRLMKFPFRTALIASFTLAQVGEFSFILAGLGRTHGLISDHTFHIFISAAILTILVTPFLIYISHRLPVWMSRWGTAGSEGGDSAKGESRRRGHVIIAGYGLMGKSLAVVLKETGIPFVAVDLNPARMEEAMEQGVPLIFGDISSREILEAAEVRFARAFVSTISDARAVIIAIKGARLMNPGLFTIVRTRFIEDLETFRGLAVNEIIPDEFEASIEIFTRVLEEFHIPRNVIHIQATVIRSGHYEVLRGAPRTARRMDKISELLTQGTVETFLVTEGMAPVGLSFSELNLRNRTGATIIAVVRDERSFTSPRSDFIIQGGDILVLVANHQDMDRAVTFLSSSPTHS